MTAEPWRSLFEDESSAGEDELSSFQLSSSSKPRTSLAAQSPSGSGKRKVSSVREGSLEQAKKRSKPSPGPRSGQQLPPKSAVKDSSSKGPSSLVSTENERETRNAIRSEIAQKLEKEKARADRLEHALKLKEKQLEASQQLASMLRDKDKERSRVVQELRDRLAREKERADRAEEQIRLVESSQRLRAATEGGTPEEVEARCVTVVCEKEAQWQRKMNFLEKMIEDMEAKAKERVFEGRTRDVELEAKAEAREIELQTDVEELEAEVERLEKKLAEKETQHRQSMLEANARLNALIG